FWEEVWTDSCVGTWGFHHPCGHIMAEFRTLGFTYTIPEMTGKPGIMKDGAGAEGGENSWGIRHYIHPCITVNGKDSAPALHICGCPKMKTEVTLSTISPAILAGKTSFRTPGPGTYTLPRILGPNTPPKAAQYSWTPSKNPHCFLYPPTSLLLLQTPGPAAFPKVDLDIYKTRAPKFSMGMKTKVPGKGALPGPAEYTLGKLSLTKARDPAFSFGVRHSLYQASLIPETHVD
uniref:ODF3A protein n=1 Tax=Junco hyemalis TaxID=40217 RepID=A0A8C5ILP5_JUNHY